LLDYFYFRIRLLLDDLDSVRWQICEAAEESIARNRTIFWLHVCVAVALMSMSYFTELRKAYFELKLKVLADRLSKVKGRRSVYTVRLRSFLFDPDLERLGDELAAAFLQGIRQARQEKREQERDRDQQRLQQAHEAIDREIMERAERLGRSYKVQRTLRRDLSLSRKKSLLSDLIGFVALGSRAFNDPSQEELRLNKLVSVLADLTDSELCNEAKALHTDAKRATTFKQKEHFLSLAIAAQRACRHATYEPPDVETTSVIRETLPTLYLRLWEIAGELFTVEALLPSGVDAEMAKAVLLVLIDPGSRERIFQKKYRPADRLKKDVARYYMRIRQPFKPECFDRTISRLHAEGFCIQSQRLMKRCTRSLQNLRSGDRLKHRQLSVR